VTQPPPTEMTPTINRGTTSERRGAPCTSEEVRVKLSRGTSQLSTIMTHPSCNCDDTDVDTTYRMCCITVGNSPPFSAATLFDTGTHTSFVNREVAAWIELQAKGNKGYAKCRRLGPETAAASVSLAGTSHTSAILGSVVFDLTFLNEVTQSHETTGTSTLRCWIVASQSSSVGR